MKNDESLTQQKKMLLHLLNYCRNNNLSLFAQQKNQRHKMHISTSAFYKKFLTSSIAAGYYPFEVTEKIIQDNKYTLNSPNSVENIQFSISSIGFPKINEVTDLFIDTFWNIDKATSKLLFYSLFNSQNSFNLLKALTYKSEQYPNGFWDSNITLYSYKKNLHHLFDVIDSDHLKIIMSDDSIIDDLLSHLQSFPPENFARVHSILRAILPHSHKYLSDDSKYKISVSIMKIFSHCEDGFILGYSKFFPNITSLIHQKQKDSLFQQSTSSIVEKISLKNNDIYQFFFQKEQKPSVYLEITSIILNSIKKNKELKNNGLDNLDFITNNNGIDNSIDCYLTLQPQSILSSKNFISLYKSIMENCLFQYAEIIKSSIDKTEIIDKITHKSLAKFILEEKLKSKDDKLEMSSKIKI